MDEEEFFKEYFNSRELDTFLVQKEWEQIKREEAHVEKEQKH